MPFFLNDSRDFKDHRREYAVSGKCETSRFWIRTVEVSHPKSLPRIKRTSANNLRYTSEARLQVDNKRLVYHKINQGLKGGIPGPIGRGIARSITNFDNGLSELYSYLSKTLFD